MMQRWPELVLLLLFALQANGYKEDVMDKMRGCKNGAEVTHEEFDEFMKPLVPRNDDEKCLMACVMKEYKIIDNGAYNPVIAAAMSEEIFKDDPIMAGMAKEVASICGTELPSVSNDCELASELIKCVVKYELKFGAVKAK